MSDVVISAAGTGSGKTLVARALALALRRRDRRVQSYKIGPDYIDGRLAQRATGRPCYNVDLWLDGVDGVRTHVAATRGDADVAVFEGMMGLYDGDDLGETSTAGVALALDAAVILVLDGWTASQTLAAVAAGLRDYEPRLRIAGAVINRVGGAAHEAAVRAACAHAGMPVLAAIAYDPQLVERERLLGLDVAAAADAWIEGLENLGAQLAHVVAIDQLSAPLRPRPPYEPSSPPPLRARIAVAEDEAFWFTYPETLLALRAQGADVVTFSPIHDRALPPAIDGLWLSGGYPEDHARALERNRAMRAGIRAAIQGGLPTYAECGGMMYLADELVTRDGTFAMAGVLRGRTDIAQPQLTIGYRTARALNATPLDASGTVVRGYEYRYARASLDASPAYAFEDAGAPADGAATATLCASFLHRHFRIGDPAIARFVDTCAR